MTKVKLPEHLFSSEELTKTIEQNACSNCNLLRRSAYIEFPTNELDTSIWSSKDIFGLSLNIYLCNTASLEIKSEIDDVRFVCYDSRNKSFSNNQQINSLDLSDIRAIVDENIILNMILGKIDQLSGSYPFGQVGSEDYIEYNYRLNVTFRPLLFNPFHFEIDVFSSEDNFTEPLNRNKLKRYQKSLASDIRNRILLEKLITPQ